MRRGPAALAVAAALAGCGTPPPDLFVVTRTGPGPGADLTLLVSDVTATCNDGPRLPLSSQQILRARGLAEELAPLAQRRITLPTVGQANLRYAVRAEQGVVRFSDISPGRPQVLLEVAAFTREIAQEVCRLER